jgi:antitoxin component of RelBE/YafQ-DinJ toxin-antitoxin module
MGHINLEIDDELRNRFKGVCATKGQTMRDTLLRFIEETVKKGGAK